MFFIRFTVILFILYHYVESITLNIDYLQLGNKIRSAKTFPSEVHKTFINSINGFKNNLFDIPDIFNIQNVTFECLEDIWYLYRALNDSSSVPLGFLHVVDMSKSLLIRYYAKTITVNDAMGVQPPGMLRGASKVFGFKQECDIIHYQVPQRMRPFETIYSRAYIDSLVLEGNNKTCDPSNTLIIGFDICFPKSCLNRDLLEIAKIGQFLQLPINKNA